MAQARDAVEAVAFASAVTEHTHDLRVLLAGLLEFELAFGLLVLVLAAPPVLAALALILRHDLRVAASSGPARGRVFAKVVRVRIAATCVHRRGGDGGSRSKNPSNDSYTRRQRARSARRLARTAAGRPLI